MAGGDPGGGEMPRKVAEGGLIGGALEDDGSVRPGRRLNESWRE